MSRVSSISGSTGPVDAAIAGLPEPVRATAQALIAELQAHRDREAAQAATMRDAKTQAKHNRMDTFIDKHAPALARMSKHDRTSFLIERMEHAGIKPPKDDTIREYLKTKGLY